MLGLNLSMDGNMMMARTNFRGKCPLYAVQFTRNSYSELVNLANSREDAIVTIILLPN
jgi:hypothetical protein